MRLKPLPSMDVVRKEDKEARLKAFIADHLSVAASESEVQADRSYLLVARSHESPVVRALASVIADAGSEHIKLKALVLLPRSAGSDAWPTELHAQTDYRHVSDMRLLDAHEQLWLDGETAWIGDCMRREPAKRDAYECYAADCAAIAQHVATAFDRLWEKGQEIAMTTDASDVAATGTVGAHIASAVQAADTSAPTASTRH